MFCLAFSATFSEKPYLIWGVIKLFLCVFQAGRLLLHESDFSTFQKKIFAIQIIRSKPLNSPTQTSLFLSLFTAFSNAPPHFTNVFHFTGNVFSTGKQPLAPLELTFAFFYGMLTILHIGVAKGLLCRCDCCTFLSEGGFCM